MMRGAASDGPQNGKGAASDGPQNLLESVGRIHFVGIGGAGMSAIAKVLAEAGQAVSGSDLKKSRATTALSAIGIDVHIGHDADLVDGAGAVVVSAAIPESNVEVTRARELGIETISRGSALAALLEGHQSIVVAGTHGKTTSTSMIVSILRAAGRDPTYLVGGELNDSGTNARYGRDEPAVAEADESDGSFLLLRPHIAVVTNVEIDHVDHWGSFDALKEAFLEFLGGVDEDGMVVVPAGESWLENGERSVITFGPGGDVEARDVIAHPDGSEFVVVAGERSARVRLPVPGRHNVSNALAATAASLQVGISLDEAAAGLGNFRGVERRWQIRGSAGGVTVIDDYAHHPTEVRATLAAARPGPWGRVVAVFQPHRYTRTAALSAAFGNAFSDADRIVITDVYGAGEPPVPGVTGKLIADAVCDALPGRPVVYLPHRLDVVEYLHSFVRPGDAVLTLGAGDITAMGEELLVRLAEAGRPRKGNGPPPKAAQIPHLAEPPDRRTNGNKS